MTVQYNWYELQTITRVPDNQLLLMFALTVGCGKKMSSHPVYLRDKLHLTVVPKQLFMTGFLVRRKDGIYSNYECEEPQNYVKNISFLHSKTSVMTKLEYLYILSQRSLTNTNDWIPEDYVEPQYRNNVYTYRKNGKIYFPWEITNNPKPTKLEKKTNAKRMDKPKKTTSTRKWS